MLKIARAKGETDRTVMHPAEWLARHHRVVGVYGGIALDDDLMAICDSIITLDKMACEPIKLVIHSPGGYIDATMTIYDIMQTVNSPVWTITRQAASAAVILSCGGEDGHRYVYPNSKLMIHQPMAKLGQVTADESRKRSKQLNETMRDIAALLQRHGAHKSIDSIVKDFRAERWMTASEAMEYGLVDRVIKKGEL